MKFSTTTLASAITLSSVVVAQDSICDKYTKALFMNNTAENQYTLLVKLVNTALIGNYTAGAKNVVNGILNPGEYMGKSVNLLPYFTGGYLSTNRNNKPASVNFIDGGGVDPLKADKPADDMSSNQYRLVTHLYEFFGALLGCSEYGKGSAFPAYAGETNMYQVHKYMDVGPNGNGYFISQVAASATSFGVTTEDITAAGTALNTLFNQRCSPPTKVIPGSDAEPQAICIASDCPLATPSSDCSAYDNGGTGVMPANATMSSAGGSSNGTAALPTPTPSETSAAPSPSAPQATGGATRLVGGALAGLGLVVAALL